MERERIFLVCNVVRVGAMDIKEVDHRRSSAVVTVSKKGTTEGMRRPFGVAAIDIKPYLLGKLECNLEQEFSIPFVRYLN